MLNILSRKIRMLSEGWLGDSTKWPEGQAKPYPETQVRIRFSAII